MADAIVSVLLDKLVSLLISEGSQLLQFDDQFEETKNELRYMQSYLKQTDRVKRKDRNEILKTVMSDLRELVYDAEDVISNCQLLFQKRHQGCASNFMSYCCPTLLKSRHQLGKQLRKINQNVKKVKEQMKSFLQTAPGQTGKNEDNGNIPLTYPFLTNEAEMVGIEDDSSKIINWILEADGHLRVIGIVGMGGIGKTTLAQKICYNDNVINSFKHSVFVTVSQSVKLDELLKKMLRKLKVTDESLKGKDVNELLESLATELVGKYLVVLDDVWGTDEGMWWERLKSSLPQVEGSCVMVTTRNEEVAKSMGATNNIIHRPQILSDEDSWSLFCKVAFVRNKGKCTNLDLERIGKEIVARCGGLPLEIKVVGGMMLGKGDSILEWRRILENLKEELASSKKDELVISRLELSYEELPTHLKPCFLCFSMVPEDSEMATEYMINWWISEGFVWGRNEKTAFEIGKECFAELLNRCLILGMYKNTFETFFQRCKMHDVVRDMVVKIAKEESFFVNSDGGGRPPFSQQSRRLGFSETTTVESIENSLTKLRTLIGLNIESKEIIASLKPKLCKVMWLRMLSLELSSTQIDEDVMARDWLSGIGSLQHLVYLHIRNSSALRTLPDSIRNLRNLQILRLEDCPNLKRLPPSVTKLEKLTAIQIYDCESFECMPEGIGTLSNLERLGLFRPVKKNGSGISQLKNLTRLRELEMEIKSEEEIEEGEWNVLSVLQHLQSLWLDFDGSSLKKDEVARKIDHELSHPLKCLRALRLWDNPGERTPAWLSPTSLPNLQFLEIYWGGTRQMGSGFWNSESGVWKVEVLVLKDLEEMDEEWPRMQRAMPSLTLFKVLRCPGLKSFPGTFYDGKWSIWRKVEGKEVYEEGEKEKRNDGNDNDEEEEEEEEEEEGETDDEDEGEEGTSTREISSA